MRTKSAHFITFGPAIPFVPIRDFSSRRVSKEEWEAVWLVCGPSVERNIAQGLDMWQVITAAYIEGLMHGSALERESDPIKQYRERKVNK